MPTIYFPMNDNNVHIGYNRYKLSSLTASMFNSIIATDLSNQSWIEYEIMVPPVERLTAAQEYALRIITNCCNSTRNAMYNMTEY